MRKTILFSLEHCVKCNQTKELLVDRDDVEIVTFPHDIDEWSNEELEHAKSYDVFELSPEADSYNHFKRCAAHD